MKALGKFRPASVIGRLGAIAKPPVVVAMAAALAVAFVACAHGGGVVIRSSDIRSDGREAAPARRGDVEAAAPTLSKTASLAGGAIIVPDPAGLEIQGDPVVHHAMDLVSTRSAVITASPGGWPVVIHNDAGLLGRDGCGAVSLSPEGDTRLTLILPEPGIETSSRFYLVGCGAGDATLTIMSEGELLNTYTFTVAAP